VYDGRGRLITGRKSGKSADGAAVGAACPVGQCVAEGLELQAATLAGNSGLRGEFAFPASDDDAGDAIAENGDGSSSHVHELIDREEKK
jgi:hypothetical protein